MYQESVVSFFRKHKFRAHEDGVEEIAVTDDYVITCGHDYMLRVWSLDAITAALDRTSTTAVDTTVNINDDFFDELT